ncbi:glycosyltransferase family 2 protein [Candidatus Omnitrophota bacterium]
MYKNSISVVIPAFNEEGNIEKITKNVNDFLKSSFGDFEIIIIDDGSIDNTYSICQKMLEEIGGRLAVLRHAKNRGYGAALRTGLFSAKKELVFYTDSDNQFDIGELKHFMEYIHEYDLVIGFRRNRQDFFIRRFCAFVYNRLVFVLFGLDVRDIDCSFKLFKRSALSLLYIETDEFLVDTELLVKAKLNNLKLKQIGVRHFARASGRSTVKFRHVLSTLRDITYLYRKIKKWTP